jgi:serine/threonine-protein kinase
MPLTTGVRTTLAGAADFDIAADGTLVYVAGGSQVAAPPRTLAWIDRQTGLEEPVGSLAPGQYQGLAMSPDGTRVAVDLREQGNDIWIWNLGVDTFTRLTFGPSTEWWPAWMPAGDRLVFGSNRAGTSAVYVQAADGSGTAEQLTESSNDQLPTSVSPDGMRIVYDENSETFDLMSATLDGERRVIPLLQTPFDERYGMISPDGRWLAYQSNESGRNEIYVRPFPDIEGGRWQVSASGGVLPLWSPSGDELLFMTGNGQARQIMAVPVVRGSSWIAGRPAPVAEGAFMQAAAASYALSQDGRRLLVIKQGAPQETTTGAAPTIVVVQNWPDELRRRFSTAPN